MQRRNTNTLIKEYNTVYDNRFHSGRTLHISRHLPC